jgi:hypothetical protein
MKNTKILTIIISIIAILALTAWILFNNINLIHPVAYIYQDNNLLYEIELSDVAEPYKLIITTEKNEINTVEVRNGEIGIIHADCHNQICVKTGFISGKVPIICLPHRLEIRIEDNKNNLDAVVY